MKTTVIGAGAMGSLFGGKLAQAGYPVLLYDINEAHIQRIRKDGLRIEESGKDDLIHVYPKATSSPEDLRTSELVIVFVKSTATEKIAEHFADILDEQAIIITLQNGVGNEEILRRVFGPHRTAAGVTSQGATYLEAGKIRHAGLGPSYICMSDKQNEKLEPVVEMFNNSGLETYCEENIEDLIWSKLVVNIGINALTALTGLHNGRLLDFAETKALMSELIEEALLVVKAKGITLSYDNPIEHVFEVAKKTARNRSSMLQDFDRKSRSEIDFINYAVVREAEKYGIDVPVNRTVTRIVRTCDNIHAEE
jgi:2-dehydropantoate 2-reductase